MSNSWICDYSNVCDNALNYKCFISPIEYSYPDGKRINDLLFKNQSHHSHDLYNKITPKLYKQAMQFEFRAKLMVCAFMKEPIAKKFGLEVEQGLFHLYGQNYRSCLSQWIYVIEGYCRQLFSVKSTSNVKQNSWDIPKTGIAKRDLIIQTISDALGSYLDEVFYKSSAQFNGVELNRHILLHGNLKNNEFYCQKNCLSVMYVLDALIYIELESNNHTLGALEESPEDTKSIKRRVSAYQNEMQGVFNDSNILKSEIIKEHI